MMLRSRNEANPLTLNANAFAKLFEITTVVCCLLWGIEASASSRNLRLRPHFHHNPSLHLGLPLHSFSENPSLNDRKIASIYSLIHPNRDLIAPDSVYFGQSISMAFKECPQYEFTPWTLFRFESFH